ncbi:penicillin-binding transpeptidase domain-containing protein [Cytobacillus praedii]|uniref:penicillin-binding protein PBP4(5) n=1 Tax=Cytobacillus praedii TaxID=1742358 RepID=UPI002E1D3A2A|nr:penicillin-binding transpeptidase domain-containing protein [Cytobacillus praedii]MED3571631.1 penicillin-binding transpeptidase domain-containing protein [Cytobacillus praedii]
MKKGLFILFMILVVLGGILLWHVFQAEQTTPEQVFNDYIKQFSEQNFDDMMQYASKEELENYNYTRNSLAKKYQAIFSGIEASSMSVMTKEFHYDEDSSSYKGRFTVKIKTFLGDIESSYDAKFLKEDTGNKRKEWRVKWNPSMILPGMEKGDKINIRTFLPKRGEILDRYGFPLAIDKEVYEMGIIPGKLGRSKEESIKKLSDYFNIPQETFIKALNQKWVTDNVFVPIALMPVDFHTEDVAGDHLPGVSFQSRKIRYYPEKESSAHLIGYVKEVTPEDLEKDSEYTIGDYIGKTGLEEVYEKQLRGKKGGIIQIQNEIGKQKTIIKKVDAIDGENIKLTIDSTLQSEMYEAMKLDAGAVTAMNPVTGEMLALVSSPSFDPNLMVSGMTIEKWKEYSEDPELPFLNRFSSLYAPGSTFKAITAAIGLTAGTTYPEKRREISGLRWKKDNSWGGYYVTRVKDVSSVNMVEAIAYSDNIYFAQEALEMGADVFEKYALAFGFKDGFSLPIYLMKSQLSNNGIQNEILLADSSYGQGEVLMSPVHLGIAFTPFINDGDMIMPVLIDDNKAPEHKTVITSDVANRVKEALIQVVELEGGTAHNLKTNKKILGAKTGTAELKSKKDEDGLENGFAVVFDTNSPSILITALVEDVKNRGESHYVTAKIKPILDSYLSRKESY